MAYPNEKRKNRAGVEAFGSGKPPQPVTTGALTDRRSVRVGGVKSRRQQPAQQDNSDIDAIFRGARESRGMVRRGMSGAQLNPDGSDPGNSFDKFIGQNPHLGTREKRQNQYAMENQQRMNNIRQQGPEAVNARRQQQALNQQIGDPNSVTGADGYRTIFDPRNPGKVIGTNAPMSRTEDNAVNRGTASPQEMQGFRGNLQKAGMQSYGSQPGKANLSGIDQIFPGQSSPPGDGAGSGLVGAGSALGAPGGGPEVVQQPNSFLQGVPESNPFAGMPMPQGSASNPYTSDPFGMFGQQPQPQRQNYDFYYEGMPAPQTGSLMEKETARRNSLQQGRILPRLGESIESGAQGMQDSITDFLRYLFGNPNPPQIASYIPETPINYLGNTPLLPTQLLQPQMKRFPSDSRNF